MSPAEWWELVAVLLGFFSALVSLAGANVPPVVVRIGSAAMPATLACVAAGLLVALP